MPEEKEKLEANDPSRPDWLPERYENPEAFRSAYDHAENKIREQGEQISEMQRQFSAQEEQFNQLSSAFQQLGQPQQQQQQNSQLERLYASYNEDPLGTMAAMAQGFANQAVQQVFSQYGQQWQQQSDQREAMHSELLAYQAEQQLVATHNDWDAYKGKIYDAIKADPDLLPEAALVSPGATAKALDRVYKMVKADELYANPDLFSQQAELLRQQKIRAQTLSGNSSRSNKDEADDHFDRLKSAARRGYGSGWE